MRREQQVMKTRRNNNSGDEHRPRHIASSTAIIAPTECPKNTVGTILASFSPLLLTYHSPKRRVGNPRLNQKEKYGILRLLHLVSLGREKHHASDGPLGIPTSSSALYIGYLVLYFHQSSSSAGVLVNNTHPTRGSTKHEK